MNVVFANRTEKKDFVVNEIERLGASDRDVYIAAAFFTESSVVKRLIEKGCRVQMVIRLGFPTSPRAIDEVMALPNVQLRVYSARSFHPKLYIFGNEVALIGSANLTHAAIWSNQEVVVSVNAEDERFSELAMVFDEYWEGAEVPTQEQLKIYKQLYSSFSKLEDAAEALADEAAKKLGNTAPANINRGEKKRGKQSLFLSHFRKAYQEGVAAFDIIRKVYRASGYRKVDETAIPLRLEIDSFISFVRERVATGESWESTMIRTPGEQEPAIAELIELWKTTSWPHFEHKIVSGNTRVLNRFLRRPIPSWLLTMMNCSMALQLYIRSMTGLGSLTAACPLGRSSSEHSTIRSEQEKRFRIWSMEKGTLSSEWRMRFSIPDTNWRGLDAQMCRSSSDGATVRICPSLMVGRLKF